MITNVSCIKNSSIMLKEAGETETEKRMNGGI